MPKKKERREVAQTEAMLKRAFISLSLITVLSFLLLPITLLAFRETSGVVWILFRSFRRFQVISKLIAVQLYFFPWPYLLGSSAVLLFSCFIWIWCWQCFTSHQLPFFVSVVVGYALNLVVFSSTSILNLKIMCNWI